MSLLERLFARSAQPPAQFAARVTRWKAQGETQLRVPPGAGRLVAIDVDVSGIDSRRDVVRGIGAVALEDASIDVAGLFHRRIDAGAAATDADSGQQALLEAVCALLEYVGKSPLVTFNSHFVGGMLNRLLHDTVGVRLEQPWLDIAWLLAEVAQEAPGRFRRFENWQARLGIATAEKHHALADAYAIAQMSLVGLARAEEAGIASMQSLLDRQAQRRMLLGD